MVELQGVSKSYGQTVALHPTDLQFEDGKTTAVIGPSGCGKSTLLRLINGLVEPSSGQVLIEGQALTHENLVNARRAMGYVIQDGGLFPHLTANLNIGLVARTIGLSAVEIHARQKELAKLVQIPFELLSRYPAELSGGQRQRIALMRALILQPRLLLLDEPLAALDPMVRGGLQTDLKAIFQTLRTTVILVTHDMAEAAYLGDTIVLLREGGIVQKGSLEDFRSRPAEPFVTEFLNAQRSLVAV